MNAAEFQGYRKRYREAICKVLAQAERGRLDEAGFPAYSHPNPLVNWLFWQRLHTAMSYIKSHGPYTQALDFGCGSGVLLPFLAQHSQRVTAMDIDLLPLKQVSRHIPLAGNVVVLDANQIPVSQLTAGSFDLITALDVLEHVEDLPQTLSQLVKLLKPGGRLVISGPTENIHYQIGRKLAGPEFSGEYHKRGIAEIKQELARLTPVQPIATLYWPLPLFEVLVARV